ncbi:MAG: phosphomannomutase/phosphoglucomutase [Candidatus Gracilibacteria bacterium]|nr:phosphomannomutase/phosphoglucomutase [Candidatus Gracilibacteria bacterium]
MKIFPLLARSYDMRAIYGADFGDDDIRLVGQALGSWAPEGTIYLGGDARLSTPNLKQAMIDGLLQAGRTVVDIGLVSSDMLQYTTICSADAALGIMITASHNPKEYNGFKMCFKNAAPINLKLIAPELIHLIETKQLLELRDQGSLSHRNLLPAWIDFLASHAQADLSGFKVVADAGNGTAGVFMQALAERLGFTLIPLYFEPDGNFPNHHPSPIESKNVQDLLKKVQETGADIGVAFDGDADRAVLCDETGEIINASITLSAISELFRAANPGKKILYNATCSHIVRDTVLAQGGIPLQEKVGHVYLKERMQQDPDIIFGGEHSSHYYFRDMGNADSGVLAFLLILEYLEQYEMSASEMRIKFGKYQSIEETNFRVTSVPEVLKHLSETFTDVGQEFFDGLTLDFGEGSWCNIRGSSNEPLIRLNAEALTQEGLNILVQKVISEIEKFRV